MTQSGARDAVTASAFITAAIYLYRKLVEPTVGAPKVAEKAGAETQTQESNIVTVGLTEVERQPVSLTGQAAQLLGKGPVAPVSRFVVGWGFTYITLSLIAEGEPDLAGSFALLVATGAILGNGAQVSSDINAQLRKSEKESAHPNTTAGDSSPTTEVSWNPAGGSTAAAPSATMPEGERAKPSPKNKAKRPRNSGSKFKVRSA